MQTPNKSLIRPLKGIRILSLALNLPGPAALMRCQQMGARCVKLEPPAPPGAAPSPPGTGTSAGDPMAAYCKPAYAALHAGVRIKTADLKTNMGQTVLHRELAQADVLLTSFRPSALVKLGLSWKTLHQRYPLLSQVAIVGSPGARAEEPGHDLTYLAENNLVTGLALPATLYADMGGSLMASEAVLQAVMHRSASGKASYIEVALASAAGYLALPRAWGLTSPGAAIGGGHAGYQVYECKNGLVAVAALEPHFAARLCAAAGISLAPTQNPSPLAAMLCPSTRLAVASWLLTKTRSQLDQLARRDDIPLHTMA